MKRILAIFILLAGLMSGYVISQSGRINSEIFDIVSIKQDAIFRHLQASVAQEINILAPNINLLKDIEKLNENLGVFSEISYRVENLEKFKNELNRAKIALFKGEIDENLFKSALENIYSPLPNQILSLGDDPLGLARQNAILKQSSNIDIEPSSGLFMTRDREYIYARAKLANGYKDETLLQIYTKLKKDGAIVSGGAIFGAFGKQQGIRESTIMGAFGVAISVVFFVLAFKSLRVFWLFLAPFFGFLSGLTACFLIFDSVHVLSIVVSTSLVGLMLDFGASWLGLNKNLRLKKGSVRDIRGLFLLALSVTIAGYALFLLSPMQFLHQIAIFGVFGLLGAFLASYFLLPTLLDGVKFNQSTIFERFLDCLQGLASRLNFALSRPFFWMILLFAGMFFGFEIYKSDFNDNVKNYATGSPNLAQEAVNFTRISGVAGEFKVIYADVLLQDELLNELYKSGAIKSANSLFSIVNSAQKQDEIKAKFAKFASDERILAMFEDFDMAKVLNDLAKTPNLSLQDLREFEILQNFDMFFSDPRLILVGVVRADGAFYEILKRHNAQYFDLVSMINQNFTQIKQSAIWLKIYGFAFAFVLLALFLDVKKATIVVGITGVGAFFTLGIFATFSDINIFVIFGVVLASAVGIDYLLFALKKADKGGKMFGISVAAMTSMISFCTLMMSQTHAVFSFGASVGLGVLLNMLCAFALTQRVKI